MILTIKLFPMLRSPFCVAMIAMCVVASQCTADGSPAEQTGTATTNTTKPAAGAAQAPNPDPASDPPAGVVSGGVDPVSVGAGGGSGSTGGGGAGPGTSTGSGIASTGSGSASTGSGSASTGSGSASTGSGSASTGSGSASTGSSNASTGSGSASTNGGGAPSGTPSGGSTGTDNSTGSKINLTTTTKMVGDVQPEQNANNSSKVPITPLITPTETAQRPKPVDKKHDASSSSLLVLSFATLVSLTVMVVAPM